MGMMLTGSLIKLSFDAKKSSEHDRTLAPREAELISASMSADSEL